MDCRGIGRLPFRQVINFEQTPATKEHMLLVIRPGLAAPPSPRHPMPPCPNKPMNPKRVHVAWGSIYQSKAQPVDRTSDADCFRCEHHHGVASWLSRIAAYIWWELSVPHVSGVRVVNTAGTYTTLRLSEYISRGIEPPEYKTLPWQQDVAFRPADPKSE